MRWYIVHAYSNFEKKVSESIREQAKQRGLEDLFEQVLVPTEKVTEVRRGRKVDTERKFFPGYVLVKMNLTDEAFHLIKNTPKVTGFLGADNKPMPITEAEAMRFVLRRGRGHRRGPLAREGRCLDLRPRNAGRARVRSGREGLKVCMRPDVSGRGEGGEATLLECRGRKGAVANRFKAAPRSLNGADGLRPNEE
jgi:transcription antitermination factor NusG